VIPKDKLASFFIKEKFGPELLSQKFTLELFKEIILKRKKSKIKLLLMDQKFIAGIGNIYASEICFCAGVDPKRRANELKMDEVEAIYNCMQKILKKAIENRGTSSQDYVDAFGRKGSMNVF